MLHYPINASFTGTMSLNELAVDLACEPAEFEPAVTTSVTAEDIIDDKSPLFPGYISINQFRATHESPLDASQPYRRTLRTSFSSVRGTSAHKYQVHGGMLRMARAMGDIGRPVYNVVRDALARNEEYGECVIML
jgi:sn1-specific diacylglycerol lipase